MTRDEVLDVLDGLSPLRRKRLERKDVPVHFYQNRILVILPEGSYSPDEQIRLDGKFQNRMTIDKRAHAFLDFSTDWKGIETRIKGGFN